MELDAEAMSSPLVRGSRCEQLCELEQSSCGLRDRICEMASSEASADRLRRHGIRLLELADAGCLPLYIDGADEADRARRLVKGGGGALTREKIVAATARTFVCVVDDSKIVERLGAYPLPVEVIPMARSLVARALVTLGGDPVYREGCVTDNGNHMLDVHDLAIANPLDMETRLNQIPGVVTAGLFAHRPADVLLIADDTGIREMRV